MTRRIAFLGLALLAAGCGGSSPEKLTAEKPAPAGQPGTVEATACIVAYLNECGWKDVELDAVTAQPAPPPEAKVIGDAWAYSFNARYTNVFGERQASANWVAVVIRTDGQPGVRCCFDAARKLVGGHTGAEAPETGSLAKLPPAEDLPPIVAPTP